MKIKGIKKCYSMKNVREVAVRSGLDFSIRRYVALMIVFLSGLLLAGLLYRLELWYIVLVEVVGAAAIPPLIMYYYMQRCESKRFNDVDIYLHQMAYSFQRYPKINVALSDTIKVLTGNMRNVVGKAITELECSENDRVYYEALTIIEDAFPCPRIKTLHKFLISIEERGGNYYNSLEVLINDYDRWVKRVYKYQKDISQVKKNSVIGIILGGCLSTASLLISSILGNSSGIDMNITHDGLYQAVSTIFIILNILYFLIIQVQCNKDWLDSERTEEKVMRDFKLVFGESLRAVKMFSLCLGIGGIFLSVVLAFGVHIMVGVIGLVVTLYLVTVPAINKKQAFNRLKEDVYIAFSEWLRDVVINLYEMPLQSAIEGTYESCPAVMKQALGQFIYDIEESPTDVRPYYTFMNEYGILDISSTVKTLYSVSELESDNTDRLLNSLIRRNYEMVDKHEELSNADSISVLKFSEYIPMIFVALKLGADMLLIISNYL
ncbi:MAG: hypothetical protein IJB96_03465 [Lachnospira sp.]|nr:hypothetical protein [Lachnospira sp.]